MPSQRCMAMSSPSRTIAWYVSNASIRLDLPAPLLPMKAVSGPNLTVLLSTTALKLRIRRLCKLMKSTPSVRLAKH